MSTMPSLQVVIAVSQGLEEIAAATYVKDC
jgi:hypothetical protein